MSLNINNQYLQSQFNGYWRNLDKMKKVYPSSRISADAKQSDAADISEEGKNALQNKLVSLTGNRPVNIKKLSSVTFFGYCNDFEKILSELSGGSVSDEFVTENYAQEKVNALKEKYISEEDVPTDRFDSYVNKMASAYDLLSDTIENKYAARNREQEYYVAEDGSIQKLTKEKELEMLDRAYQMHSELMASSTEIWADLKDFQPQITYDSGKKETVGSNETDRNVKAHREQPENRESEIKIQAYQAFMAAISLENRNLLREQQGSLNHVKLNLGITASVRAQLNSIWDL